MDLFISYARKDIAVVSPLVAMMHCTGAKVFLDVHSIEYGENWKSAISQAISNCERLILLWSKSASESSWIRREYLEARAQEKLIIPVMLDETPLPSELADIHGCSDLVPLISAFEASINQHHASASRLFEGEMSDARRMTKIFVEPKPHSKARKPSSIREKLKRVRGPRVVIPYDDNGKWIYGVDPDSRKFAEGAASVIQSFTGESIAGS